MVDCRGTGTVFICGSYWNVDLSHYDVAMTIWMVVFLGGGYLSYLWHLSLSGGGKGTNCTYGFVPFLVSERTVTFVT